MGQKPAVLRKAGKAVSIAREQGVRALARKVTQTLFSRREQVKFARQLGLAPDDKNTPAYDSEYQENTVLPDLPGDVRPLAFYLPQYHVFPENESWWGKGFTEWTNVRRGTPRFEGHYQPRVPHRDIGYYCLDDIEVMKKQARLAREHGVYGFCFYYYWFSGKRLLERPVDLLLRHPEVDIPFCLCWANENWTRTWDGQNRDILIGQNYSREDDEAFLPDMKKYLDDPRYIRVDGKPVIVVYNPAQIPDCRRTFDAWRRTARETGVGEILIWTCRTADNTAGSLGITDRVDGEVCFPPHNLPRQSAQVQGIDLGGKKAGIFSYRLLSAYACQTLAQKDPAPVPVHPGIMLGWDNAARRKDGWNTYYGFRPESFYDWAMAAIRRTREDLPEQERYFFINAWNEWGEGTYLEPDEKYGYAGINTLSRALAGLPFRDDLTVITDADPVCNTAPRIAVQVHMFYTETLAQTVENLNFLPLPFDAYFTTDTEQKAAQIRRALENTCRCEKSAVLVTENRGRDVLPFLTQMAPVAAQYDYICHIHSKKTVTGQYGGDWRNYCFRHLFGSEEYLRRLFAYMETQKDTGIFLPPVFPPVSGQMQWGANRENTAAVLKKLGAQVTLPGTPLFPAGNMFWARTQAISPAFQGLLSAGDFPEEAGQTDGTTAHAAERCWLYLAKSRGFGYRQIFNAIRQETPEKKNRLGIFAHYDKEAVLSQTDLDSVRALSQVCDVVFVTNSPLPEQEFTKLSPYVKQTFCRENTGLDFGAWQYALTKLGWDTVSGYDSLTLLNNSCFAPLYPMGAMYASMESTDADFWGVTLFPACKSNFLGGSKIPEHLQSYCTVYSRAVTESAAFRNFWTDTPFRGEYRDVVRRGESRLTGVLARAGFRYRAYLPESGYLCTMTGEFAPGYRRPADLVLLGSPFIKKKSVSYASASESARLRSLTEKFRR